MASPNPVETRAKFFTIDEANRTLPLVRAIVQDIVAQFERVDGLRQRLGTVSQPRRPQKGDDFYAEERSHSLATLESEEARLRELIEELEKLGVELKGTDGLCDFPARREGRLIYFCWRLGEDRVRFWHEAQAGYAGRIPVEAPPGG